MAGFRDLIASPGYKTFMRKMLFYSVMIIIVGLVFIWRHWPGGDTMTILGGGVFVTWLIFFIIEKIISNQDN